jgi:cardiolipin synthase
MRSQNIPVRFCSSRIYLAGTAGFISSLFNNRSFSINDEANLNVLDADFARAQDAVFDQDWQRARPMTLAAWHDRSWTEKLSGEFASLLGSQL